MKDLAALFIIPIALIATYFLLRWKAGRTRDFLERCFLEENIEADILHVGVPPIWLWLRNRKGDSWAKVEFADGELKWARVRSGFSGTQVDWF